MYSVDQQILSVAQFFLDFADLFEFRAIFRFQMIQITFNAL